MVKRLLVAGSLALAMVISGCGNKNDVEVDTQATSGQSGANGLEGIGGNTIDGELSSRGNAYGSSGDNSLYSVYFGFDRFIIG